MLHYCIEEGGEHSQEMTATNSSSLGTGVRRARKQEKYQKGNI